MEVAAGDDGDRDEFLFDGLDTALTDAFMAAMSLFVLAVERGERDLVDQAVERLRTGLSVCGELNMLPQWWTHRIAIHLIRDLWSNTFHERVPREPAGGVAADWPRLRELFIALLQSRTRAEMDLWPSQDLQGHVARKGAGMAGWRPGLRASEDAVPEGPGHNPVRAVGIERNQQATGMQPV